jgi:hypothetical protein
VNLLNLLPESAVSNPLWRSQPPVLFRVSEQAISYLPSAICHLPSAISHLPSTDVSFPLLRCFIGKQPKGR